ncbi:MAG TPA: 6-hydroxymethylpterin diphosphokinase MptE-like protein [Bacillales bacterium]|nr:6-hydroxymethylpterin diphosphokinase MptE-like protein [Bacillales bacterium]
MEIEIQSNRAVLQDRLPQVYEQIKHVHRDEQEIRAVKARKVDAWILEKKADPHWASLYSKFNPFEESEMWAASINGDPKHIVLFGFGMGYHFDALIRRFPHALFHIIEPDPQLLLSCIENREVPSEWVTNIEHFIVSDRHEDYEAFFQAIIHFIDEGWTFLSLPKFEKGYDQEFRAYEKAFSKIKKNYSDRAKAFVSFEKVWNFNALKNLPHVYGSPNIFDHRNLFKGKTVILTASGPSLNDALPLIRKVQREKKAIVIAAGTSVNGLLNKGIKPDFFVSYDPKVDYRAYKEVLDKQIPFIFGSTVCPGIPSEYEGPMAHMKTFQDKLTHFFEPDQDVNRMVIDAPTITAVTLDLLNKLGVETVYMAGQDLCFINEKTGAEGVYFYNKEGNVTAQQRTGKEYVENNNGEMAETNPSFLSMKRSIEALIGKMDGHMGVYSLSLYGAKIKGMPYVDINEAETKLENGQSVELNFSWNKPDRSSEVDQVVKKLKDEIGYFSDVKGALERQLEKFQSASPKQKDKWQIKVDHSLDRLTHHNGYEEIIYPLVVNRINYMVRLKSNAEFSDPKQVKHYYDKGVRPLTKELAMVLEEYQSILSELKVEESIG